MYKIIISIFFSAVFFPVSAQRISIEEYVEQYKEVAMDEMKRSGVPAAITLAQGILESESGNSELVKRSNNHFGIKCKSTWTGETVSHDDDENGECFRAYNNAVESYRDHSNFLKANERYRSLFDLDPVDYEEWAKGLKKAGYATNPKYPALLIQYIQRYELQQYSLAALGQGPKMDVAKAAGNGILPGNSKPENVVSENTDAVIPGDPGKVIRMNDIKCVFVTSGTSLLAVANKNNISLNKIMEFNELTGEGLLTKDQYIYLHKKSKAGTREFYIVQSGETVYDIAQLAGIQLKYLLEYNSIQSGVKLSPGTKLFLQPGFKSVVNTLEDPKTKIHLVAAKEGLYAIAKAYKVSIQELIEWNKLESDDLKIGQEIIISK